MVAKASKPSPLAVMKATAPRVKDSHVVIDATQTLRHIDHEMQAATATATTSASDATATTPSSLDFPSFQATAKQVTNYGATALARWDKKSYTQKRQLAQGYRAEKSVSAPLRALQGMNAKNVARRDKAATRARDSGLQVKTKRKREAAHSRTTQPSSGRGEDVGIERGGGGSGGRGGDGMVRVGRAMAERLSRPDRHISVAKRMKSR